MNPDHDDEFKAAFINATRQKLNELVTARVQIDRDNLQLLLRIMEGSVFLRAVVFDNLYRGIFDEAIWCKVNETSRILDDDEEQNSSRKCRAIFNTMSDLLDFSTSIGLTTTFKRTVGGKVIEASVLCYAYVYMSFLNSDYNKYRNFFLKRNWPTNFINVGTGLYLARGSSVQVNGQALVFVLNKVKETAFLEGRKQSVTFYEVCVPDALKGLVDLGKGVSIFGGKMYLPAKYISFRSVKNPRLNYHEVSANGTFGNLSFYFRVFETVGGVLIMNSGMRAKILTPPDLVASPLVVPEGFLLNTLPQTPGALNLKVGKYAYMVQIRRPR